MSYVKMGPFEMVTILFYPASQPSISSRVIICGKGVRKDLLKFIKLSISEIKISFNVTFPDVVGCALVFMLVHFSIKITLGLG